MENMTNLRRKILFYMHAGSGNHGCEAIVRSLCEILDEYEVTLLTHNIDEDRKYGLDKICKLVPVRRVEDNFLAHVYYYVLKRLFHKGEPRMAYEYKNAGEFAQYEYAVSIGGDNYCYEDALYDLRMANSMFHKKGVKTALVGCSVEPSLLDRSEILADMNLYDVIVTREQVTHEALKSKLSSEMSDSNTNLYMTLDPAFVMKCDECTLPDGFVEGHTIGINVSPMILNYENPNNSGVTLENYKNLIKTILDETSDVIALIPHVVNRFSDDRKPIDTLFSFYKELVDANPQYAGRVLVVGDMSAEQLKYVISKCRLLITARTHASIAAY